MRLLFLCKRSPQQRDLIKRPYGRFYHLPTELATLGHDVHVSLCSHRRLASVDIEHSGVHWSSHDALALGPLGLLRSLSTEVEAFRPDWIIGCSDTWCGWLAHRLAQRAGTRLAIDAYDNYEAYMPWNLPLHWLWRHAVRAADMVTAAGPHLAQQLQSHRNGGRHVEVLPMAADPEFTPRDKASCRQLLGLPQDALLLGYIGSWARTRGTEMLLEAFRRARAMHTNLHLVLSGHPPDYALREPGVINFGYVLDDKLPFLVSALDIACVVIADTDFGRYSYPAKLCEATACAVPVVASATESVRWMLDERREHLATVGDPEDFSKRILDLLASPRTAYGPRNTWPMQAQRLEHLLMLASTGYQNQRINGGQI